MKILIQFEWLSNFHEWSIEFNHLKSYHSNPSIHSFIHFICAFFLFSSSFFFGIFIVLSMPINISLLYGFTTFSCPFSAHNLNDASTRAKYHHPYACFDTALITSSIDCFDSVRNRKLNEINVVNFGIRWSQADKWQSFQ